MKIDSHPYDMKVVDSKTPKTSKYFTMSSKGLSTFIDGAPVEFTKLNEWLI